VECTDEGIVWLPISDEVITNGVQEIGDNTTDAERTTNRGQNKDCKATFMIYQSIDEVNFDKIYACASSKLVWDTLEKCHTVGSHPLVFGCSLTI